jgi:hypothetical protein
MANRVETDRLFSNFRENHQILRFFIYSHNFWQQNYFPKNVCNIRIFLQANFPEYEKHKIFVSTHVANNEKICWVWKILRRTDNLLINDYIAYCSVCQLFYVLFVQTVQKIHS